MAHLLKPLIKEAPPWRLEVMTVAVEAQVVVVTSAMSATTFHSQVSGAPPRRPHLPCVPAPVYRVQGSMAVARAPPASQSGSGSPGLLTPLPRTPSPANAAATRSEASVVSPEAVGGNPEGGARPEPGTGPACEPTPTPQPEAGPTCEPEREPEAGPTCEPEPEPGTEASPPTRASGSSWARPKLRRNRTVFSISQVGTLEKAFQKTPYPSLEDTAGLAQELRITEAQVKIWFQNRRKKLKRQLQEQAQFLAPTQLNPFWTLVSPRERRQPDYHTYPFPHGQNSVPPPTCTSGFSHSLYTSRDLQALGLQMPYHHPNFS